MITAIAIDDEPKAISIIKYHVAHIAQVELVETFNDAEKALVYLKANQVQLIFLDINMPKLSGLQLLAQLEVQPLVIITSAYAEFALDSYSFKTVDYLLKPFELDRFQTAVYKVEEQLLLVENSASQPNPIFIKDGNKKIRIDTSEILYIRSDGNYLDIHLVKNKISPRMTFFALLRQLPKNFMRVHNSYAVNLDKIDRIEKRVLIIQKQEIPVSPKYQNCLSKIINSNTEL